MERDKKNLFYEDNVTVKQVCIDGTFTAGNNFSADEVDVIHGFSKLGDNSYVAISIKSEKGIIVGDDANIPQIITTAYVITGNNFNGKIIDAHDFITLGDESRIAVLKSGSTIKIGSSSNISSLLSTQKDVIIDHDSYARDIFTLENVFIGYNYDGATVNGKNIYCQKNATIKSISASLDVVLDDYCVVTNIRAEHDVILGKFCEVSSIECSGTVLLGQNSTCPKICADKVIKL